MGAISETEPTATPDTAKPVVGSPRWESERLTWYVRALNYTIDIEGSADSDNPITRDSVTRRLVFANKVTTDGKYVDNGVDCALAFRFVTERQNYRLWLCDSLLWAIEEYQAGRYIYAFRGLCQAAGYAGKVGHCSTTSDAYNAVKNAVESVIEMTLTPDRSRHVG